MGWGWGGGRLLSLHNYKILAAGFQLYSSLAESAAESGTPRLQSQVLVFHGRTVSAWSALILLLSQTKTVWQN